MSRNVAALVVILVCLGLSSCDLFSTRPPEEPSQKSSNYVQPIDAGKVLENMVNAFHDGNAVNHAKSFTDSSFSFEAAATARNRYGGVLLMWDKSSEQQYFEKVASRLEQNSTIELIFEPFEPRSFLDSSEIETVYHLTVPHKEIGVAKKFSGRAQFTFFRNSQSGFWSIHRWVDNAVNISDSTWSDLKGVSFSQW